MKEVWYWNNYLTLIKMAPNEEGLKSMVKCSEELQELLEKEVKEEKIADRCWVDSTN